MTFRKVLLIIACLIFPLTVFGHGGGLDKNGGHYNRKTGEYHYHQKKSSGSTYIPKRRTTTYQQKSYTPSPPTVKKNAIYSVTLKSISDGDTITVSSGGKLHKISLYGIDCPEKGQAYGQNAKVALAEILKGRSIKIKPKDIDRYGRIVAVVYADGYNANELLIRAGYAWTYRQYCKDSFCSQWLNYEKQARNAREGLWSAAAYEAPWIWRKSH